jgi:hypothetical protein
MKFLNEYFWKKFNMVFEKALDDKCEYKSMCSAYQKSSSTCTDEAERSFCGIYKQLSQDKQLSQETLCIEP